MKIIVIGGTGTIGAALVNLLRENHEVIAVGKNRGDFQVDVTDKQQLGRFFKEVGEIDGIISTLGEGKIVPFDDASEEEYFATLNSKLMNNIRIYHEGKRYIKNEGFIIFTSGLASTEPVYGGSPISVACAAIEAFVRSSAIENTNSIRLNVVSPAMVKETMVLFGMDGKNAISAQDTAKVFLQLINEGADGVIAKVPEYLPQNVSV